MRRRDGQGAKRGDQIGPNPTDRAKNGSKRRLLSEGNGWPIAAVVAGANVHDSMLLQDTLQAVVIDPPNPLKHAQHLCLDKGYSGAPCDATARVFGYLPHVRQIGQEKLDGKARKRHPARRWVVERGHAWWNGCRSCEGGLRCN